MPRRRSRNRTGLERIPEVPVHDAWAGFACLQCRQISHVRVGGVLLDPEQAFATQVWKCAACGFVHSRSADLPFDTWPGEFRDHGQARAARFWQGFFRIATEDPAAYWKQCNACGRILPFAAFSRHAGWGPLERQMECRACKGAINAVLNVKRTAQQLHEGSARRRIADLLLEGENRPIDLKALFARFGSRCFKSGQLLDIRRRKTWAIDHILPSKYLYPLTAENAALLSREMNDKKGARWPKDFYTASELVELARITGADLNLLASPTPIINQAIDVDACVERLLKVRERTTISKRVRELRKLLTHYGLAGRLSAANRKLLGF